MMKDNYRVVFSSDYISHAVSRFVKTKSSNADAIDDQLRLVKPALGPRDRFTERLRSASNIELNRYRSALITLINDAWSTSPAKKAGDISFSGFQEMFLKRLKDAGYDAYALLNDPKFFTRYQTRGR